MYKDISEKELGEEPFKLTLDHVKSCIGFPKESGIGRSLLGMAEDMFPENSTSLLKVLIETSPNPKVAHEMLSGVYEQPNLARETNLGTLVSYDVFTEEVTYTKLYQEKRYFSDKENADLFKSRTHSSMDVHVKALGRNEPTGRFTIPTTGWISRVETCMVAEWQSATIADESNEADCFDGDSSQCE